MLLHSSKLETYLRITRETVSELFKVSLVTYLVFYLIESYKAGFISNFFNLDILLWVTIGSGILTVWLGGHETGEKKEARKIRLIDYSFIFILGIISALLIYFKIKVLGRLAWVIAVISGVTVVLLSILFLTEGLTEDSTEDGDDGNWLTKIKSKLKK